MPLFAKEPTRVVDPGGTPLRTLQIEDCDESDWVYFSSSRSVRTLTDKVQRKLGSFESMTPYERTFVRIKIRNGFHMTLQTYDSDTADESEIVRYYDLSTLYNARNLVLDESEALPFLTFDDDGNGVTEMVYGQIGLRLELLDLTDEELGTKQGAESSAGVATSSPVGGAEDFLQSVVNPMMQVGATVVGDPTMARSSAQPPSESAAAKTSRKLQKKLERKGKALALHLVFPNAAARDEWLHWFRTLICMLELQKLSEGEIDPISGELIAAVDDAFVQRFEESRSSTVNSQRFRNAVKEFTNTFLNVTLRSDRSLSGREAPNGGALQVRMPHAEMFAPFIATASVQRGEVLFTLAPREKSAKNWILESLTSRRSGIATLQGSQTTWRLRLHERAIVVAQMPWSCEFQVVNSEDNTTWYFVTTSVDVRNQFVNWFRIVKGRGQLAQSETQSFPFKQGQDEEGGHEYSSSAEDQKMVAMVERIYSRTGVNKAAAEAAAFLARNIDEPLGEVDDAGRRDDAAAVEEVTPALVVEPPPKKSYDDLCVELYNQLQEPPVSPRSNDSVHSVRKFTPFPSFHDKVTKHYVDETCQIHLLGRPRLPTAKQQQRERRNDSKARMVAGHTTALSDSKREKETATAPAVKKSSLQAKAPPGTFSNHSSAKHLIMAKGHVAPRL